jgi:hypothetical protein
MRQSLIRKGRAEPDAGGPHWSLLIRFDFHSFGDVRPAGDEYRTKENRIIFLFSEGHARAQQKKLDSKENPSPFLTRIFTDTRSRETSQ